MTATIAVVLPAAGRSTRFGGREKKPFVSLEGRPVWLRAAELFWSRDEVYKLYLVVAAEDREMFRSRFAHLIAFANAEVVEGGAERTDSVANALARIPEDVPLVAIHDAVRPLTPHALIDAVFAAAQRHGAAIPALPVADTLKQAEQQRITATVSRQGLYQAQTPQVFRRDWLAQAYMQRTQLPGPITDDAQLVEAAGFPVAIVPGSPLNFKITTPEDLELAEAVIKMRASRKTPSRLGFHDEAQW